MKQTSEAVIDPDRVIRPTFVLASELRPGTGQTHQHARSQLIYADAGVMVVASNKGRWVVTPRSGVWVPGGVNHQVIRKTPIHLSTLYMPSPTEHKAPACRVISISPLLKALLLKAGLYPMNERETAEQSRLLVVLKDEVASAPTHKLSIPIPGDKRAKYITDRLINDPANMDSLSDWSKRAGASRRTLERAFQYECGMSFIEWRQQMRLLHAIELLSMKQSVTQVALSVGYSDVSFFIHIFKRYLGITPGRYF